MKKLTYTLALVVMGFTASYAQKSEKKDFKQQATPEIRAEKAAIAYQQKLNLSTEQTAKIKQVELDRFKKNEEWRKNDQALLKNKMEERKAYMKANNDKVNAILTAEQQKTLQNAKAEKRDKMKARKGDKGKKFKNEHNRSKKDKIQTESSKVN